MKPVVDTKTPFIINMATFQAKSYQDKKSKEIEDGRRNK